MHEEKHTLRKTLLTKRKHLQNKTIKSKQSSQHIIKFIKALGSDPKSIAIYLAKGDELCIDEAIKYLLKTQHLLFAPAYINSTWQLSAFKTISETRYNNWGIRQPVNTETLSSSHIDLWLVPGLAFDTTGNRLGYGKGIYDRWLFNSKGLKIGISYFDCIIKNIPTEKWDQKVSILLSEKGVLGQDN